MFFEGVKGLTSYTNTIIVRSPSLDSAVWSNIGCGSRRSEIGVPKMVGHGKRGSPCDLVCLTRKETGF